MPQTIIARKLSYIYDPDARFTDEEIEKFFREQYKKGLRIGVDEGSAKDIARWSADCLRKWSNRGQ